MRVVHYINQFFAGVGAEEAAGTPPERREGAVGPGRRLQALLGDQHQIVATVFCGDDYAASTEGAAAELLELVREADAELLVAGPAFTSGRYGLACAAVAAEAARAGIPAIAAMHPDNPAAEAAAPAIVVASGEVGRTMGESIERLAAATAKLAAGEPVGEDEGRIGLVPRRNRLAELPAAERAVRLLLGRIRGEDVQSEVPLPRFGRVSPAAPLEDPASARIALLTEGALVPQGNPDRLESARTTRWLRYSLEGRDGLDGEEFQSVHGGFSTVPANDDPHRLLPLDAARELEREGAIGSLHHEYFTTVGNGTSVAAASRIGVEWAAELRKAGVQAAILTST